MGFTRKDYEVIADCLAEVHAESGPRTPAQYALGRLEAKLANQFALGNEAFDVRKFYDACVVKGFGSDTDGPLIRGEATE